MRPDRLPSPRKADESGEPPCALQLMDGFSLTRADGQSVTLGDRMEDRLLAFLALHDGQSVTRDRVIAALWPDASVESARNRLRQTLYRLRARLEELGAAAALDDRPGSCRVATDFVAIDLAAFHEAARALRPGIPPDLRRPLRDAVIARYRGTLLPGLVDDWALEARRRCEQVCLDALDESLRAALEGNQADEAVRFAQKALEIDPWREDFHQQLLRAYRQAGRDADAKRHYDDFEARLHETLGARPSPVTRALALDPQAVRPPAARLPLELRAAVGREAATAQVAGWIVGGRRLVTLTGLGGIGKTRLALEIARSLAAERTVLWLGLAAVREPEHLWDALAASLNTHALLPPAPPLGDPAQEQRARLRAALDRPGTVLVLDNLEHLQPDRLRTILTSLLQEAPHLSLLLTSRVRTGVAGERILRVEPLPVPQGESEVAALERLPGVRLLIDRAQDARPSFALSAANARSIAALAARLEGVPLAIELAAARLAILSPEQLLPHLEASTAPALKAILDWTCARLAPPRRALLTSLAAFRGGWTVEAARTIHESEETLEGLMALQELGLIQAEGEAGGRFRMLETVRSAVWEQAAPSVRDAALRDLARWVEALLAGAAPPEALIAEHDNLIAALYWALDSPDEQPLAVDLALALREYWRQSGRYDEGREALLRAIEAGFGLEDRDEAVARLIAVLSLLGTFRNDRVALERAQACCERGFARMSDPLARAFLEQARALVQLQAAETTAAREGFLRAFELSQSRGPRPEMFGALFNVVGTHLREGDYEAARDRARQIVELTRDAPATPRFVSRLMLAAALTMNGEGAEARTILDECATRLEQLPDPQFRLRFRMLCAMWAYRNGRMDEGERLYESVLEESWERGDWDMLTGPLLGLAHIALQTGEPERAMALLGALDRVTETLGHRETPFERGSRDDLRAKAKAAAPTAARHWHAGYDATPERIRDLALRNR